jgi:hypothetical protein
MSTPVVGYQLYDSHDHRLWNCFVRVSTVRVRRVRKDLGGYGDGQSRGAEEGQLDAVFRDR